MLQAYDENWTKILVDASCFLKAIHISSEPSAKHEKKPG